MSAHDALPRLPQRRLVLALVWLGLVAYATCFAPADRGTTGLLIRQAMLLDTAHVDGWVIAVFNLLGVLPAVYASVLLADGAGRKLPAWPFVLGSFAFGAFALLPYLVLRNDQSDFVGSRTFVIRWFDSRASGLLLTVAALGLVGFGLSRGEPARYAAAFADEPLVHVMSIDFVICCLVFPAILADDMARRGLVSSRVFWAVSLVPLLGPLAYLAWRPPLSETAAQP